MRGLEAIHVPDEQATAEARGRRDFAVAGPDRVAIQALGPACPIRSDGGGAAVTTYMVLARPLDGSLAGSPSAITPLPSSVIAPLEPTPSPSSSRSGNSLAVSLLLVYGCDCVFVHVVFVFDALLLLLYYIENLLMSVCC